uniref:Uncharacterized protein n=2 Tax=Lygus hesperus TaxID=30085 RepID=A0A0K8SJ41_LYGHE
MSELLRSAQSASPTPLYNQMPSQVDPLIAQRAKLIDAMNGNQHTEASLDAAKTFGRLVMMANSQRTEPFLPMMLMVTPTQSQTSIPQVGSQLNDNADAAVQPKEQATELKTPYAENEGMNEVVRKLVDKLMHPETPNDVVKETTEQPSSR